MTTAILDSEAVCKLDKEATDALDPAIAGAFYGVRCEWSDLLLGQCACKDCRPDLADIDYGDGVDLTGVELGRGGNWKTYRGTAEVLDDGDDFQPMSIPVTKVA